MIRAGWRSCLGLLLAALCLSAALSSARAVDDAAIAASKPPRLLSAFGFFDDLAAQEPADGVLPFAPNSTLFSDYAVKRRFVYVPAGKAARYDETEAFDFPEGTALIKTFAYPADFRAPDDAIRLIETRVLLRQADGWHAWAYLWNDAQSEAELKIAGAKLLVETVLADGSPIAFTYSVPNKNQCKGCHAMNGEIVPIGPKARNLNGELAYADGSRNQLAVWTARGILSGAPEPGEAPKVPDWHDSSQPLEARARAWLDINCAHCHRAEGAASNSGLFLTWNEDNPVAYGVGKRPVAAGRGSGGRSFDIEPGEPERSILPYRFESTEPGVMMPELGRSLTDPEAVAMLRQWIAAMR